MDHNWNIAFHSGMSSKSDLRAAVEERVPVWAEHAAKVRIWTLVGARVIVPLQRGRLSAGQMLERAVGIFGTDRICAGIPSNLEAISPEDCFTLRHNDFHILGRVRLTSELKLKLCALLQNNPAAQYTADANWLRSRIRQISGAAGFKEAGMQRPFDSSRTRAVREVLRCEAYSQLKKSTLPSLALAYAGSE